MHRRQLLQGILGAPVVSIGAVHDRDAKLVDLGHEYLEIARELERLWLPPDLATTRDNILLERVEVIDAAINLMRATSLSGLRIKAELANWSRSGDLKPSTYCLDERMAWAIVNDLCSTKS